MSFEIKSVRSPEDIVSDLLSVYSEKLTELGVPPGSTERIKAGFLNLANLRFFASASTIKENDAQNNLLDWLEGVEVGEVGGETVIKLKDRLPNDKKWQIPHERMHLINFVSGLNAFISHVLAESEVTDQSVCDSCTLRVEEDERPLEEFKVIGGELCEKIGRPVKWEALLGALYRKSWMERLEVYRKYGDEQHLIPDSLGVYEQIVSYFGDLDETIINPFLAEAAIRRQLNYSRAIEKKATHTSHLKPVPAEYLIQFQENFPIGQKIPVDYEDLLFAFHLYLEKEMQVEGFRPDLAVERFAKNYKDGETEKLKAVVEKLIYFQLDPQLEEEPMSAYVHRLTFDAVKRTLAEALGSHEAFIEARLRTIVEHVAGTEMEFIIRGQDGLPDQVIKVDNTAEYLASLLDKCSELGISYPTDVYGRLVGDSAKIQYLLSLVFRDMRLVQAEERRAAFVIVGK